MSICWKGRWPTSGAGPSRTVWDCTAQLRGVCNLNFLFSCYVFHLMSLDSGWTQESKITESGTLDRVTIGDEASVTGSSPTVWALKTVLKRPWPYSKLRWLGTALWSMMVWERLVVENDNGTGSKVVLRSAQGSDYWFQYQKASLRCLQETQEGEFTCLKYEPSKGTWLGIGAGGRRTGTRDRGAQIFMWPSSAYEKERKTTQSEKKQNKTLPLPTLQLPPFLEDTCR